MHRKEAALGKERPTFCRSHGLEGKSLRAAILETLLTYIFWYSHFYQWSTGFPMLSQEWDVTYFHKYTVNVLICRQTRALKRDVLVMLQTL